MSERYKIERENGDRPSLSCYEIVDTVEGRVLATRLLYRDAEKIAMTLNKSL